MITYRTCLFDMRLDDLWDPDQRWALLSDTASKHARTDPVVFLCQYYFGQLVFSQFTSMKVLVRTGGAGVPFPRPRQAKRWGEV